MISTSIKGNVADISQLFVEMCEIYLLNCSRLFSFFFLSLIFHTCRWKIARTYAIALFLNLYYFTLAPRWFSDFLFYRRTINEIALFLRRDKTEKLKAGERFNLRIADLSFGNNRFFLDPSNFFFKYKTILLSESLSFRKNFGGINK